MTQFRTFVNNIPLILTSILIIIFVIDILLRYTQYDLLRNEGNLRYYYNEDPINGYDISENFPVTYYGFKECTFPVWSNEIGCFDNPYLEEKEFIILLGDSFTWGWVPFKDKWGTVLQENIGIKVLKCGVPGYGLKQEYHKLQKIINKIVSTPKLIVVGYFLGNDLLDDYLFPKSTVIKGFEVQKIVLQDLSSGFKKEYSREELNERVGKYLRYGDIMVSSKIHSIKCWLIRHSVIYNLIRQIDVVREFRLSRANIVWDRNDIRWRQSKDIIPFLNPEKYYWLQGAWKNHLQNFREMKNFADSFQSKLLIVLIPTKEQIYEFLRPSIEDIQWDFPNKKLINYFQNEGILYLDLTQFFKKYADNTPRKRLDGGKDLYWSYDGHWNNKGNLLAGLLVAEYLLETNLIHLDSLNDNLLQIKKKLRILNE